jgi:hypothetical protein
MVFVLVEVDGGPGVASLDEGAFEDLHDAVGVCVTAQRQLSTCPLSILWMINVLVDWTLFTGRPYQYELLKC